ncbi:hypothetical protein GF385_03445 [Candidatus Dependentiae bacterium]|nr:hypothetical protein [Candidatus Dependentiae bacterium]
MKKILLTCLVLLGCLNSQLKLFSMDTGVAVLALRGTKTDLRKAKAKLRKAKTKREKQKIQKKIYRLKQEISKLKLAIENAEKGN